MADRGKWTDAVHHDGSPTYVGDGAGGAKTIRLRMGLDAPVQQVFIRTAPDGEQAMTPMRRTHSDGVCQWWEGELRQAMPRTSYRFLLMTAEGNWWLSAAGVVRHNPPDATDFRLLAHYAAPEWVRDSVFYQIFPDRFADGDPSNNVRNDEYRYRGRSVVARQWGEAPRRETGSIEFFGGDLQGVTERLPYLEALGVTAVYLNPVFTAPSNHKYDVEDFDNVDPHLGGNAALAALRRALDERGMRLLLDIVPNHLGATHKWFREAQADPHAPTAEFFTFRNHPHEYDMWLEVPTLPKLNYRSERLRAVMYGDEDAVMRKWLRAPYRIDGWRIDVANMLARQGESQLGHKVGRAMRRAIKSEFPDAYLMGEHFFDGSPHLQGDELDASMNYQGFTFPVLRWLAGEFGMPGAPAWADRHPLPTEAMAAQWQAFRAVIPWQVAMQQFNLLGSHDTARVLTVMGEDEARARVAATLLFTYPGTPSVFYGDEVGLTGGGDPSTRVCMPWEPDRWNHELREFYQALIRLRRTSPALRWGGFQLLHAAGETVAFLREAPEERLIVVARRGDDGLAALPVHHGGIADGTSFREATSGAEAMVQGGTLPLRALGNVGAQVWRSTAR